jgi:hypothetical protein
MDLEESRAEIAFLFGGHNLTAALQMIFTFYGGSAEFIHFFLLL